jgi:hypothetical protein
MNPNQYWQGRSIGGSVDVQEEAIFIPIGWFRAIGSIRALRAEWCKGICRDNSSTI